MIVGQGRRNVGEAGQGRETGRSVTPLENTGVTVSGPIVEATTRKEVIREAKIDDTETVAAARVGREKPVTAVTNTVVI